MTDETSRTTAITPHSDSTRKSSTLPQSEPLAKTVDLPSLLFQGSTTSLLEAVVGSTPISKTSSNNRPIQVSSSLSTQNAEATAPLTHPTFIDNPFRSPAWSGESTQSSSTSTESYGTSTEREWDVLSDASLRLNEGEVGTEEVVLELQKKVDKR